MAYYKTTNESILNFIGPVLSNPNREVITDARFVNVENLDTFGTNYRRLKSDMFRLVIEKWRLEREV